MAALRSAFAKGRGPAETEDAANQITQRYGVVLGLLLATFVFLAVGERGTWTRPVTVTLLTATLLASLSAAQVKRRTRRLVTAIALVCVVGSFVSVPIGGNGGRAAGAIMSGLLVAIAPVAIATSIVRHRVVDIRTVLGAICIYVLLGLLWAFVYSAIGAIRSQPFFAQTQDATSAQYVYFSFVTLTTVGYGDLTAVGNFGRACAALEALLGQIYLVTVVALLVSNLGRRRGAAPAASDSSSPQ